MLWQILHADLRSDPNAAPGQIPDQAMTQVEADSRLEAEDRFFAMWDERRPNDPQPTIIDVTLVR